MTEIPQKHFHNGTRLHAISGATVNCFRKPQSSALTPSDIQNLDASSIVFSVQMSALYNLLRSGQHLCEHSFQEHAASIWSLYCIAALEATMC